LKTPFRNQLRINADGLECERSAVLPEFGGGASLGVPSVGGLRFGAQRILRLSFCFYLSRSLLCTTRWA
jgi:hypothetical protein